jgi:hypothetical protein
MLAGIIASLKSRFIPDSSGNIAIAFSIALIPLIGVLGAAIDYSRASLQNRHLQDTLDGAALAAASGLNVTDDARIQAGTSFFHSNIKNPCNGDPTITIDGLEATASKSCSVQAAFLGVVGVDSFEIAGTATAVRGESGMPLCILALDPSMRKSLLGGGGTEWIANDCTVQVNSSNDEAVSLSGGSSIKSGTNCFVGGVKDGLSNILPKPEPSCDPVPDPFASVAKPTVGACDYEEYEEDTPTTLSPGVYCDGLIIKNSEFKLNPGLYIIKDGEFKSTGGATIIGEGVTFYLVGEDAGLIWGGGGTYHLTAMKSGELAGFVIYLDPDAEPADNSHVSGGGDTYYEGVLYFPNQELEISGGGSVTSPSPFTAFVANSFSFTGGSKLLINVNEDATDVPIPSGLLAGTGSTRLIN